MELTKTQLKVMLQEAWRGYSNLEKGILWVFFILGGGFIGLMLLSIIVDIVHKLIS